LVRTCLECGHSTGTENLVVAKCDYDSCPHPDTDNRGSTKSTVIVFCKDCNNIIDVRSREEAASSSREINQIRIASTHQQKLTAKILDEHELNLKEVNAMFELFKTDVQTSLKDRATVTSTELVSMLEDAIDASKGYQRRAMMHVNTSEEDDSSEKDCEDYVPPPVPKCVACGKITSSRMIQTAEGLFYHEDCKAAEHWDWEGLTSSSSTVPQSRPRPNSKAKPSHDQGNKPRWGRRDKDSWVDVQKDLLVSYGEQEGPKHEQ
jgi:hypothetical protein